MSTYAGEREFGRAGTPGFLRGWLDAILAAELHTSVEAYLYVGLFVVAIALRFTDLGARALHHDESLHALFSYGLSTGKGYVHDPLMHGPFLFHITALIYQLFGASDATSRFAPALFGSALVLMPLLLRPWTGRVGAFAAAAFIAFSPSLLYYSRFIRNEAWVAVWTLGLIIAIFRYRSTLKERYLYMGAAMLMLEFVSKETAFMISLIVLLYLNGSLAADLTAKITEQRQTTPVGRAAIFLALLPVAWLLACLWPLVEKRRERYGLEGAMPANGVLLLVLGLLTAPQFSAAITVPLKRLHYDINAGSGYSIFGHLLFPPLSRGATLTVVSLLVVTLLIGIWWDARRWLICLAIFYIPFFLLYTTFLTNTLGWGSGIWGSLSYWLDQQDVRRGNQPVFYFAMTMPTYEYLTLALAAVGLFVHAVKRGIDSLALLLFGIALAVIVLPLADGRLGHIYGAPVAMAAIGCFVLAARGDSLRQFLVFYTAAFLFGLSVAGEKMPWLTVHLALPVAVLAGIGVNDVFAHTLNLDAGVRRIVGAITIVVGVAAGGLALVLAARSANGSIQLIAVAAFLAAALVAFAWLTRQMLEARRRGGPSGNRLALRIGGMLATAALIGFLGILTLRNDWRMNWVHGDTPDEMLIYTQTSPDVPKLAKKIDQLALESGLGHKLPITVDGYDSFTWPWAWYLRDYTAVGFPDLSLYATNPSGISNITAPWVLLLNVNDPAAQAVVNQFPGQFGPGERYHHRWWFPEEGYRATTAGNFFAHLRNGSEFRHWWTYVTHRDGFTYPPSDVSPGPKSQPGQPVSLAIPGTAGDGKLALGSVDAYAYFCAGWIPGKGMSGNTCASGTASAALPSASVNGSTLTIGAAGFNSGQFRHPAGIAADMSGNIYVADTINNRIQKFDASGKFLAQTGGPGGTVQFNQPWDLAVDPAGNVFVADTWNHRIVRLDKDLHQVATWGQGTPAGGPTSPLDLYGPRSIALDGAGNVWITDTGNARVIEYDANGKPIQVVGSRGTGAGQFDEPVGIAIGSNGSLYVADTWNNRVQSFDGSGRFAAQFAVPWATTAPGHGAENKPYLAAAPDGSVIVTFPDEGRVVQYDAQGHVVRSVNQLPGTETKLQHPLGVAVTAAGDLVVSDSALNQVIRVPLSALP
jgi:predicted membrane-bound mannosyltransferase/DNA-binding beta-propeller fold protein YncE